MHIQPVHLSKFTKTIQSVPQTQKSDFAILWKFDGSNSTIIDTLSNSFNFTDFYDGRVIVTGKLSNIGSNLIIDILISNSTDFTSYDYIRFLSKGIKGNTKRDKSINSRDGGGDNNDTKNYYLGDTLSYYNTFTSSLGVPQNSTLFSIKKGLIWKRNQQKN